MKNIEKILVATDFTEASEQAIKLAVLLAKKNVSHVHLLHVIPRRSGWPVDYSSIVRDVNKIIQGNVEVIRRGGLSEPHVSVLFGNPVEEIIDQAESLDVNVVMIGSGEKETGDRFPLGVKAENILRGSSRPVWVVKKGASEEIKKILCPVDFSEHSRRALVNAISLSTMLGAELQVLTVAETISNVYYRVGNMQADWKKYTQKEFTKFLGDFDFGSLSWNKMVRSGEPHEEILNAASEVGADLMVMGSLGKTGLLRFLMGSVAEKVARELPCSLIMMKAHGMIEEDVPDRKKSGKLRKRYEPLEKMPRKGN
ncbi:MAG: universal stress protein [Deltaproteobacteria bacterium]|nr:universal stress protein [Deltaproteobacteria bacterium]